MAFLLRQVMRDVFGVLWSMPNVALVAFTVALGMDAARITFFGAGAVMLIGINLVGWFLMSLYFVTVHRFVILGEVAAHYPFAVGHRNLKFFFTALFLALLAITPVLLATPIIALLKFAGMLSSISWLLVVLAVASICFAAVLTTRLVILLPAIAVDAPGAGWVNAYRDTQGYAVRIFMTYLAGSALLWLASALVSFILFSVSALLAAATAHASTVAIFGKVGLHLLLTALTVLGATFFVALASRLFVGLADRTKAPAAL